MLRMYFLCILSKWSIFDVQTFMKNCWKFENLKIMWKKWRPMNYVCESPFAFVLSTESVDWMAFVTSSTMFTINKMFCIGFISVFINKNADKRVSNQTFNSNSYPSAVSLLFSKQNSFIEWLLSRDVDLSDICLTQILFVRWSFIIKSFWFEKNPDVGRLL